MKRIDALFCILESFKSKNAFIAVTVLENCSKIDILIVVDTDIPGNITIFRKKADS